jgi:hypothetical protein
MDVCPGVAAAESHEPGRRSHTPDIMMQNARTPGFELRELEK